MNPGNCLTAQTLVPQANQPFVELDRKQHPFGPAKDEAMTLYRELMASRSRLRNTEVVILDKFLG
jgi:hypothetical protein